MAVGSTVFADAAAGEAAMGAGGTAAAALRAAISAPICAGDSGPRR